MFTSSIKLTSYARRYRRDLMSLVERQSRLHLHLDWQTVDDWIDDPDIPLFLAWNDRQLLGAMSASLPLNGAAWLRLAVVADDSSAIDVLSELWVALRTRLLELHTENIGVLLLRPWITQHLGPLGFAYDEDIITLRRYGAEISLPPRDDVHIRLAERHEIPIVTEIDHAAFQPMWQLNANTLRQAVRFSTHFTVAEWGGEIVGYQLSTQHYDGAHLARLAVRPEAQGKGIGGLLVAKMINHFAQRNINSITVNTQQTNHQSRRLYQRYDFQPTDLNMAYWSQRLHP